MTSAYPHHEIPGETPEVARLSEMIVALLGELSIVTERLDTVERLLQAAGVVQRSDIETFTPDADAQNERDRRRVRQIEKVFRPFRDEAERVAQTLARASSAAADPASGAPRQGTAP